MFGLMRPEKKESCNIDGNYRRHRMHYCGTCKALGLEYGQRTRAVLNFDAVFFAEMLSQLSKENLTEWQTGYQAINRCFTMPEQEQNNPLSLRYAAATNVLLSELKTDDNIKDLSGIKWTLFRHLFSTPFRKAQKQLEAWGLDVSLIWEQIKKQENLEKSPYKSFTSLNEALKYYAAPSATITALVFEQGAKVIGQEQQAKAMYDLGYQFGELIYILDAFEDYEEDLFHRQFNPLFSSFGINGNEIMLAKTSQVILAQQESISQLLQEFSLPEEIKEEYSVRLFSNITSRLQKERRVPLSFKESAMASWNNFTTRVIQQTALAISNIRYANYYLVSVVIFVLPLVVESISTHESTEVYKWMAGFTGFLGSIGLVKFIIAKRKKRKVRRKKWSFKRRRKVAQRRMRRFFRKAKKRLSSKRPCAGDCFVACTQICLEEACYSCTDVLCSNCCESYCQAIEDGKVWPWASLVLIAFGITMMVLFL